jgi:ATP-dependent Clp protease ATP-binding subunit ClpC
MIAEIEDRPVSPIEVIGPVIVVIVMVSIGVLSVVGTGSLVTWLRRKPWQKPTQAPIAHPGLPGTIGAAPDESPAAKLNRLGDVLGPLGERSAHPRDLLDAPEFRAAVDLFGSSDVPLAMLRQYAFGANWPLSCAALEALTHHAERDVLLNTMLAQLGNLRPWPFFFALRYIASLSPRPPVGMPAIGAQTWWAGHLIIPDLFREYFDHRQELGDQPGFGDYLGSPHCAPLDQVAELLRKVEHPFARKLLEELKCWQESRIDREFLTSFGRLWTPESDDALVVEPASWREQLDHATAAVLHEPPRSMLVSGDPRIGKTSFLKLLATRLRDYGWIVFEASGAQLMADQTYIGQLEGRIRRLVAELDARKKVAWYVMDLVQIAESGTHQGQTASILDQVLPAVAAGRMVILGEASPAGVSRLLQRRPSLSSLIEVCRLSPMSEAETEKLAGQVGALIERRLEVGVASGAVRAALQLAQQYLGTGQMPGAVVELLKRAAANALSAHDKDVTPDNVLTTLSQVTGLPRSILDDKQRIELRAIREILSKRVMGQDEAVGAVVDRIAMLKAGLVDPNRPVGVFLFAGPTGTGKTELAKALAEFLFGSAERMVRLDMSEFQTAESTAKILGSRGDGMHADSLIERVRKQPFSVVLLDEFEKAHANTWDLFLQIFDDGRLTDANGRVADFRHTIIILTSNLGATSHRDSGLGFLPGGSAYTHDQIVRAVGQTFRPEFVNRLDKIIVFQPLSRALMRTILLKELDGILERRGLRSREWAVEWEDSAIEFLLDRGFSPEMGARPLKRAIDQHLLAPLAATLVEHRFPEGDQFLFVRSDGKSIQVEFVDPDAPAGEVEAPIDPAPGAPVSLAGMILRPAGTVHEHQALVAAWLDIETRLASAEWTALRDQLRGKTTDPDIWSRPDRRAVFAQLALTERVEEAARTAARLKMRLESSGSRTAAASRELVSRLALQLYLVQHGITDAILGSPIDALLIVEPALEYGSVGQSPAEWCGRLEAMYKSWAARRRMQIDIYASRRGSGATILHISGFGAYRVLEGEAGLHVVEDTEGENGRRVARIKIAPGPWEEPPPSEAYGVFAKTLAQAAESSVIVRRYRGGAAPLVRDVKGGWRSGRLDSVLAGDFDLIGALANRNA